MMQVRTGDAGWVVPPQRAVDSAGRRARGANARGEHPQPVHRARSAIDDAGALPGAGGVAVAAATVAGGGGHAPEYDTEGRDGALATLLLHELAAAETLPLHVPLPPEPRWLALCEAFLVEPDICASAERWAGLLHTSLRSFNRTFRRYTGLSFGAWKQRACVVQALARLAGGETVTAIALDCGYQSPAAFSTIFRGPRPAAQRLPGGRAQIARRSMKRFTGVASSDAWWLHRSKILWQRCGGKRVARLALNFSCSSGMPSRAGRRWPSGYSPRRPGRCCCRRRRTLPGRWRWALVRLQVFTAVARLLDDLHFLAQAVDQRWAAWKASS